MTSRGIVQNGDEVEDEITGFKGIVVAITTWLNGCERISVQPRQMHEGKPVDAQTFDVEQIRVLKAAQPRKLAATGGPHDAPARHTTPPRH